MNTEQEDGEVVADIDFVAIRHMSRPGNSQQLEVETNVPSVPLSSVSQSTWKAMREAYRTAKEGELSSKLSVCFQSVG